MTIPSVVWQRFLENSRLLRSVLNKQILVITDRFTKEWCIAVFLFAANIRRIGRASGWLFLALYLKQCKILLQKFYAEDSSPTNMTVYVSVTRTGIPRIIPSFHRRIIRKRSKESDRLIQLYLSLFSVSRLIACAPRVTKKTLESITSPHEDIQSSDIFKDYLHLIYRYVPEIVKIPLRQGLSFQPTWKSLPSMTWLSQLHRRTADAEGKPLKRYAKYRSVFTCLPYEIAAFAHLMRFVHAQGDQWSQGTLWCPFIRYADDHSTNKNISGWSLSWFESRIGPLLPYPEQLNVPPLTGRLSCVCEGDGKRRIFAIGNYINQRLLAPVHDWLACVLRKIPMDGTFHQVGPLDLLKGCSGDVYSIDLKAATDRWPLLMLFNIIMFLFDRSFASAAVNSALATNVFDVSFYKNVVSKKRPPPVCFVAGQPLGYHASWPSTLSLKVALSLNLSVELY